MGGIIYRVTFGQFAILLAQKLIEIAGQGTD